MSVHPSRYLPPRAYDRHPRNSSKPIDLVERTIGAILIHLNRKRSLRMLHRHHVNQSKRIDLVEFSIGGSVNPYKPIDVGAIVRSVPSFELIGCGEGFDRHHSIPSKNIHLVESFRSALVVGHS